MKYLLFSLLLSALISGAGFAQPLNEAVSTGNIFDGEPNLAINPANPDNMVIAWMSYDASSGAPVIARFGIRVRSSFDGGKSWGNEILMPHISKAFHSADVSMAFHKNGTLYIEYIDYQENPDSGGIAVAHSTDGGKSWSTPIKAFDLYDNDDKPLDRPWIAIDNSGTASDGTIYITTKPVYWDPVPNHPYMKYSTDGGNTWSKIAAVDGGDYQANVIVQPMVSLAVASDGTFLASYASWPGYADPVKYTLAASNDKGATYTRTTIYIPTVGSKGDTLSKLGYHLAVNPLDPKNMIFVTVDYRNGDNDIYSAVTTDGGAAWVEGLRINDDPKANGVWQDLVWANYSDNGKCAISWRDRRNGDSSGYEQGSDIYFAVSTDGGKSFGKNIRLSNQTAPFAKILDLAGNDFQSTAIIHDSLCTAWGDTRNGKIAIYFAKAALTDGIANVVSVSKDENRFSIYPNPANNSISIGLTLEESETITLSIFDVNGKQIWYDKTDKTNNYSKAIDLSKFSSGIFTIIGKTSKEMYTKKFTVNK
jgi:hypothetical protein